MKIHAMLLALGWACSLWPGFAVAGYAEAQAAYDQKDFATAQREYALLAAQGNAKAQHNLGVMYERGEGVKQDYREAAKWYRLAADQGIAASQYNLGVLFESQGLPQVIPQVMKNALQGIDMGVPQDDQEAVKWFRLAADQGYGPAMGSLGVMYAKGRGVPRNDQEAVKWFRLAAAKWIFEAAYNLALCYQKGQGVEKNPVIALSLYSLLAAGRPDSRASAPRDELAKSLSAREVGAAQDLTRELRIPGNFLTALDKAAP